MQTGKSFLVTPTPDPRDSGGRELPPRAGPMAETPCQSDSLLWLTLRHPLTIFPARTIFFLTRSVVRWSALSAPARSGQPAR